MKKNILIAVLSALTLATAGYTATWVKNVNKTLVSERGNEILHPGAVGKSYYRLASTTGALVCTGKCLLFDVILASGAAGSAYATVEDSYTAEAGSGTIAKIPANGATGSSLSRQSPALPILCEYGITIDLSSVANGEEALVIYKDLD